MKPKKKLVYKLQSNVHENPFKKEQNKNLRHYGCHSYDFAKLRSYKAFSLNSLSNQSNFQKQKKNLFTNDRQTDLREQTKKYIIENIQGNKKLVYQQAILIKKKSIQIKNKLRESNRRQKMQFCDKNDAEEVLNNNLIKQIVHKKLMLIKKRYQQQQIRNQVINNDNKVKRISDFALPEIQDSMIQKLFEPFSNPNSINQLKAKQFLMKQIQEIKQYEMNKKILESIKQKSNKNLQRLPRSQSQVIKNDKWKQKYSFNTKNKQSYLKISRNQSSSQNYSFKKIDSNYWTKTNSDEQQNYEQLNTVQLKDKYKICKVSRQTDPAKNINFTNHKRLANSQQQMKQLEEELSMNLIKKQKNQKIIQMPGNKLGINNNDFTRPFKTQENLVLKRMFQNQSQLLQSRKKVQQQLQIQQSQTRNKNKTEFKTYSNTSSQFKEINLKTFNQKIQLNQQSNTLSQTKLKKLKPSFKKLKLPKFQQKQKQDTFHKQKQFTEKNKKQQTSQKQYSQHKQKQFTQYENRVFAKLIQQVPMSWEIISHEMLQQDYDFGQFQAQNTHFESSKIDKFN